MLLFPERQGNAPERKRMLGEGVGAGAGEGGNGEPLLLDRIGVRDIDHLVYQTTAVVVRGQLGLINVCASFHNAHAPEHPHLHVRAWLRRDGRPRDDCRPRTGRPGRLVWREHVIPSGSATTTPIASAGCRVAPIELRLGHKHIRWMDEATSGPPIQPS